MPFKCSNQSLEFKDNIKYSHVGVVMDQPPQLEGSHACSYKKNFERKWRSPNLGRLCSTQINCQVHCSFVFIFVANGVKIWQTLRK